MVIGFAIFFVLILHLLFSKKYAKVGVLLSIVASWLFLTFTMMVKAAHIFYEGATTVFSIKLNNDALRYFLPVWFVLSFIALVVCITLFANRE